MAELTTDECIRALEREGAELKQNLEQMAAERRPFDELRSEIKSVGRQVSEFSEREQGHEDYMRARFGVVDYDLKSIDADIKVLQTGQLELRENIQALQVGQQEIATGQRQILEFLLGKPKQND